MRILIVSESYNPQKGYREYYLSIELSNQGHEVRILTYGSNLSLSKNSPNITLVGKLCSVAGLGIPSFGGMREISYLLRIFRPQVIIYWPLFSPLSLTTCILQSSDNVLHVGSIMTGGPIATSYGFYSPHSLSSTLRYAAMKLLVRAAMMRIGTIFTLSTGIGRLLEKHLGVTPEQLRIMPLGADTSLFKPNDVLRRKIRRKLLISDESIVIVYSGSIDESKEIPVLLRAVKTLVESKTDIKLILVSDEAHTVMPMCKNMEIENHVLAHSAVSRTDLPAIYSAADIGVWPGGPSISIAEAASCGLPLVIRKSPFTSYLISNGNGYSFRRGDNDMLARHLKTLATNSRLREKMSKASRELILGKLSWRKIASRFVDECKHLLHEKNRTQNANSSK